MEGGEEGGKEGRRGLCVEGRSIGSALDGLIGRGGKNSMGAEGGRGGGRMVGGDFRGWEGGESERLAGWRRRRLGVRERGGG